jgi:hypothetical protein
MKYCRKDALIVAAVDKCDSVGHIVRVAAALLGAADHVELPRVKVSRK